MKITAALAIAACAVASTDAGKTKLVCDSVTGTLNKSLYDCLYASGQTFPKYDVFPTDEQLNIMCKTKACVSPLNYVFKEGKPNVCFWEVDGVRRDVFEVADIYVKRC